MTPENRPNVLTIAGFDPSSGAGLTADIKTFESLGVYGLGVCTANTVQNDIEFHACHWISVDIIVDQIHIILERFKIGVIKIGIIENWKILNKILDILLVNNSKLKIILDPVISSSTKFTFHEVSDIELDKVLEKIFLLTPNFNEIQKIYPNKGISETVQYIRKKRIFY
ncbi:bifunctional hydroxymethylpyrimidine kinase/phosphomethylpyrimidine kinase [Tritonibacter mobilis]|nr:bifunctional hydroxymethylpyrimidine kinase/phosphomethylpyrimidine kinase [Tritonibacter mobilis]